MITEIPNSDCPEWLRGISNNHVYDKEIEIPWHDLLKDSIFCPLSGLDPSPIQTFEGKVHSFVFADHEVSKEQILEFIKSIPSYTVFDLRVYDYYEDLEPDSLKFIQTTKGDGKTRDLMFYAPDPDPCVWAILKKSNSTSESDGNRISVFFMCQESCLAFNLTYKRYGIAPKNILLPRDSGREYWTDLKKPNTGLMRMVKEAFPEFSEQHVVSL